MYLSFFGLNDKPFAITPDPRYLYMSERHAEALAHLVYGINEAGGFIQLTGEVGTGKTTVIRSLLAQTPSNAEIALILNPRMSALEFLLTICEELGIGVPDTAVGSIKELVDVLNRYLLRAHAEGRRVVLVVDEAQNLAPEVLEQVRLLTNLETETQKLLQIILIGQPELRDVLGRTELRQLAQRITGRYHLAPLSGHETSGYARHRLKVAGATADIFSSGALRELHRVSGGVPRLINIIADRALLGAYTQDRHRVNAAIVRAAASEVTNRRVNSVWLPWVALAAGIALALGVGWALSRYPLWPSKPAAPVAYTVPIAPATVKRPPPTPIQRPSLDQLLERYGSETDTDNAFNKLFALWGLEYRAGETDACTQAVAAGLGCLSERGSLAQLRLYNRPAILTVTDAAGATHQVVLAALSADRAAVSIGGERREIPLDDLGRMWFGDFVMLWQPGSADAKPLTLGMRGAEVQRLRDRLEKISGSKTASRVRGVFDQELQSLVQEFQRSNRLEVDGVANIPTLVVLDSALAANGTPLLDTGSAKGG